MIIPSKAIFGGTSTVFMSSNNHLNKKLAWSLLSKNIPFMKQEMFIQFIAGFASFLFALIQLLNTIGKCSFFHLQIQFNKITATYCVFSKMTSNELTHLLNTHSKC